MSDQPSCYEAAGDGVSPVKRNAKGKVRHFFYKLKIRKKTQSLILSRNYKKFQPDSHILFYCISILNFDEIT